MNTTLHARLLTVTLLSLGVAGAHAQTAPTPKTGTSQKQSTPAPQAMNYQGIARDLLGQPLQRKAVALRLSVLAGGADAPAVYSETHRVTTTDQGAFSLALGRGTVNQGSFASLQWGSTNHFLRVEIDPAGGNNFRLMGTSELLSVPYALYAGMAGQLSSGASTNSAQGNSPGVPSQNWSLFGNSRVDPITDRLGTTDAADLVIITNNIDRLTITSGGNVAIRNDLGIGNDLTVNRNVTLNIAGGATINNGPLTVARNSATALTGTLNVDGATNLGSTLNTVGATTLRNTLGVDGATNLGGTLNTVGATTLRNTLGVTGATTLGSTLVVSNATSLGGVLGVNGATTLRSTLGVTGATSLASTLGVSGATTLNSTLNANGKVTINASLGGGSSSTGAYPLTVMGSDQGMLIQVNGTSENSKHYMTFTNGSNQMTGSIKGQTLSELHNSFEYGWEVAVNTANIAFILAEGVATAAQIDLAEAVVMAVEGIVGTAEWAKSLIDLETNVGVTYESGSGDYAEWLERANETEKLSFGDIVGVRGGRITKNTSAADHLLVVSMSPIVLGNAPAKGRAAAYEKVAFMGQVPVKVKGTAHVGDYVLASGQHDGLGRAVAPSAMTLDQYRQIVGVAWSASKAGNEFSLVNVAVGLNNNDLTTKLEAQQQEINQLRTALGSVVSYLQVKDPAFKGISLPTAPAPAVAQAPVAAAPVEQAAITLKTKPNVDKTRYTSMVQMLANNPELLRSSMTKFRNKLISSGVDLSKAPELERVLTDESYFLTTYRKMQEGL